MCLDQKWLYPQIPQFLGAFTISKAVRGPSRRVETPDKVELFGRQKTFLALDDDHIVRVDGFSQLRKRVIVQVVEVGPVDDGSELFRISASENKRPLLSRTLIFLSGPCSNGWITMLFFWLSSACGISNDCNKAIWC